MKILARGLIGVFSFLFLSGVSHPVRLDSPSLTATEEEVRQFVSNYIERYNQRDLIGFLSLFSSKAIQNQKDGLERIRTTYDDFFGQSKALRYRVEDMRIEIYQNAVEVEARYELNQTLKRGGKEKAFKGHVRWILVREDGRLKILSLDFQPEKSP